MPGWKPGQSRCAVSVDVACCPKCGTPEVRHMGHGAHSDRITYWKCPKCEIRWKGAVAKAGSATIVQ